MRFVAGFAAGATLTVLLQGVNLDWLGNVHVAQGALLALGWVTLAKMVRREVRR